MAELIYILWICKWANHVGIGLIWIRDPENLGVDTKIISLSFQINKLLRNNEISVMAALIYILWICKWANHFGIGLIWFRNPENIGVDTKISFSSQINELWPNNEISVMAALICILWICKWPNNFGIGLIWFRDPENIGVDTKIISLSFQIKELWPNNEISVMAALICILCEMPKGAKLASSGFLISTPQRYKIRKKTLWGRQNHVHPKRGFSQLD